MRSSTSAANLSRTGYIPGPNQGEREHYCRKERAPSGPSPKTERAPANREMPTMSSIQKFRDVHGTARGPRDSLVKVNEERGHHVMLS